jgi:hypothetical protein
VKKKNPFKGVGVAGALRILDSMPRTAIDQPAGPRLSDRQRFDLEEQQEQEQRLAPLKANISATVARFNKSMREYWSGDLRRIAEDCNSGTFFVDEFADIPLGTSPQSGSRGKAEYETFIKETLLSLGYVTTPRSDARLLFYGVAQCMAPRLDGVTYGDMGKEHFWQACHERLLYFEAYGEDLGVDPKKAPRPAPPEPVLDLDQELEKLDTSTEAGRVKARDLVMTGIQADAKQMFDSFFSSLVQNFGVYLTESEIKAVVGIMKRRGLNFMRPADWDAARVACVKAGTINSNLLYPSEIAESLIENADTRSYEGRQQLKADLAKLGQLQRPEV